MKPTRTFDLLDRFIQNFPDKHVLSSKINGKWEYYSGKQYHEQAHYVSCGLLKLGLKQGDKVITVSNNRPEWNILDMGMAMIGIVHVPVYTSMNDEQYNYILKHSDACLAIVSDSKLYDKISVAAKGIKEIQQIYSIDEIEGVSNWMEILNKGKDCAPEFLEKVEVIKSSITEDDLVSLIYTSGTTGVSKGVMLSHRNLVSNFMAAAEVFRLGPEDRYLSILPLCHVGGRLGN